VTPRRAAALLVATAVTATLVRFALEPSLTVQMVLFLVAAVALAVLVLHRGVAAALDARLALGACAVVLCSVVVIAPRYSTDVANYAAYGRMLSEYGASPYTHEPAEFTHDPVIQHIPEFWQDTPSPYGPGFTAVSAAGMSVVGESDLGARLLFQGLALAAALGALVLLWKLGAPAVALLALGLHPTTVAIVNGGNNDLLVGLAALGCVALVTRSRYEAAGLVAALGVLVKVGGLLPLVGILAWVVWKMGRAAALRLGATAAAAITFSYLLAGGAAALEPLRDATWQWSRSALWNLPRTWLEERVAFHGRSLYGVNLDAAEIAGRVASVTILVATVATLFLLRKRLSLAEAAVIGPLVFLLGAAYTLPRYALWALPVAALVLSSWPARLLAVSAGALQFLYLRPPGPSNEPGVSLLVGLDRLTVPVLVLSALAIAVTAAFRARRAPVPALR
jgi:alpha-1,6-mannosyltransferase